MKRYYVGCYAGGRMVFSSSVTPTEETYGDRFTAVIGPMSLDAARIMRQANNNPHIQCVADAERIARNNRRKERDQVYRDLGMTKVRGNLGGTYWE